MKDIRLSGDKLYVSYTFLKQNGVSEKSLSNWSCRKACIKMYFENIPFVEYATIPKPTRKNLPNESDLRSLLNQEKYDLEQEYYTNCLRTAYERDFLKYRDEYQNDNRLTPEQATQCARLRAVWEKILQYDTYSRINKLLHKAFTNIYDGKYSDYNVFSSTKTKARKNINSVVIDTRWFREQESTFDNKVHYWAKALLSDPVNNTGKSIWRNLAKICNESQIKPPSYSWVKKFVKQNEKNVELFTSRFGKVAAFNHVEPYAKIIHEYSGSQWQIDGWELPFYYKGVVNGKTTSFLKLVLFVVRDAYSKKIVGYSIDTSENTQMILEGLQDAVKNTGYMPYEILSDNHSFNKTNEASFFKQAIESIGVTWTVDHNPRRKSIAERHFRHLGEIHCKDYPGYIGQGIKTKEKSGRPSQDYLDEFQKSGTWLTENEIKLIGVKVVDAFNNTPLSKLNNKTPNEVHEQSEKPYSLKIDLYDRLRLFTKQTELKVIRGQINLTRKGITYEYQLNAEQIDKLNGSNVIVRYEDFSTIYLFDKKDRPFGSVIQKVGIHGALAEQTPDDIKLLYKNKGRLTGVKTKAKKNNEALRDKAIAISPDAFEALNPFTTPKNVLKEIEQNYLLKNRAHELGINLDMVEIGMKPESLLPKSLKPKERKTKSPFSVRGKHKVECVNLNETEEDY